MHPVIYVNRDGCADPRFPVVVALNEFARRASISLHTPVSARYLRDLTEDDLTPPTTAAPPPMHL